MSAAATPCRQTAELASAMACDAATLAELLAELIGDGNEATNTLACMVLMVQRLGWLADTVAAAHGAPPFCSDADGWHLQGTTLAAQRALAKRRRPPRLAPVPGTAGPVAGL